MGNCLSITAMVLAFIAMMFSSRLISFYSLLGITKHLENVNLDTCERISAPGLEGCETVTVFKDTAFLACSIVQRRRVFWPPLNKHDPTQVDLTVLDPIFTMDVKTKTVTRLDMVSLPENFTYIGNAIAVYPISETRVRVVVPNFMPLGAVMTLFTYTMGTKELVYETMVHSESIITPNSVVFESADVFYVTNDHATAQGIWREIEQFIPGGIAVTNVVKCEQVSLGTWQCGTVIDGLRYANGITLGTDGRMYVAETVAGVVRVFERKAGQEKWKPVGDPIPMSFSADNMHVDAATGAIYVAGFPTFIRSFGHMLLDPAKYDSPVQVAKITNTTGEEVFYGRHYQYETVVMDATGQVMSGVTSACPCPSTVDATGHTQTSLILTQLLRPDIFICTIPA